MQDKIYILRDVNGLERDNTTPYTTITEDNLKSIREGFQSDYGWYAPLSSSGEKIMANALTLGGVITFNSFAPSADDSAGTCSGNLGQSRTYTFELSSIYEKPTFCELFPEECDNTETCPENSEDCKICVLYPWLPECKDPCSQPNPPPECDICNREPPPEICKDPDPENTDETWKTDPKPVIVPCDDPQGCNCEDRAVKILSGTSMTDSELSVCDMFETSSWKEEI